MMKFEVVVIYNGKEYVKLNEALGHANEFGTTKKVLTKTLKPVATKLKGLGNTLYVLKSNLTKEPTEVDKNQEQLLLDELAHKNKVINELYQEQAETIDKADKKYKALKQEKEELEEKIKELEFEKEGFKLEKEYYENIYNEFMKTDKKFTFDEEELKKDNEKIKKAAYEFSNEISKLLFVDCEPDIYDEVHLMYYNNMPANEEELKKNYRKLVKKYHPDVYGDDRIFKQLDKIKELWEMNLSLKG